MSNLIAYHGDPAIKKTYLARVREHARLDHLVQGTGWKNGKGCAVGCTLEAYDHARYPIELGVPEWLAHLEDGIFEELPWDDARTWPERFLDAIPVGADLEPVQWQQAIWRHERQLAALEGNAEPCAQQVRDAIGLVIDYCRARLDGTATEEQRKAARSAAAWSAESAAESAESAAAWSAESAAESAAWSAASAAAWSAESAAASAAFWSEAGPGDPAHWHDEAENLLQLLANARGGVTANA
jgi:hypothetical protein